MYFLVKFAIACNLPRISMYSNLLSKLSTFSWYNREECIFVHLFQSGFTYSVFVVDQSTEQKSEDLFVLLKRDKTK